MLKVVPFDPQWINHDKLDIKAMYRRPRWVVDQWGERQREYNADGLPTWDIVGPLPIKKHNHWVAKGFEYITLANRDSLRKAAKVNALAGSPRDYDQHATGGPWNYRLYAEGQLHTEQSESAKLRADVEKFGAEAVETIRQQTDPSFRLPPELKKKAKTKPTQDAA